MPNAAAIEDALTRGATPGAILNDLEAFYNKQAVHFDGQGDNGKADAFRDLVDMVQSKRALWNI